MTVMNNPTAMMSLGELNKNVSKLGKDLAKVASGQKIVGAGDGASEYAISERMRVRKRALDRDEANVQTGISLLNVAAGGIQQQIEIMKNIKAKVIDADNDSNTDLDRLTIQKEISQGFEHINDIAYETNYNGKLLLVGNKEIAKVSSWQRLPKPRIDADTDLGLIPDVYPMLDGITGPFDVLDDFETVDDVAEPLLGTEHSVQMIGGTAGTRDDPQAGSPASFTMDFTYYDVPGAAEGVGFYTSSDGTTDTATYYVLTSDPGGKNHRRGDVKCENVTEIDISSCNSPADIAQKVAAAVSNRGGMGATTVNGAQVTVKTQAVGTSANSATASGWSEVGASELMSNNDGQPAIVGRSGALATGLLPPPGFEKSATGNSPTSGTYVPPRTELRRDPDTDMMKEYVVREGYWEGGSSGSFAVLSLDISTLDPDDECYRGNLPGIRITGPEGTAYLRFKEGSEGLSRDATGVYSIGRNANVSSQPLYAWNANGVNDTPIGVSMSITNGQLIFQATSMGTTISIKDGFYDSSSDSGYGGDVDVATGAIKPKAAVPSTYRQVFFSPVTAYQGNVTQNNDGIDPGPYHPGDNASYTIDLSSYDNTDADQMEYFIGELKGKILNASFHGSWEFIDKKVDISLDAIQHSSTTGGAIDLNKIREAVAGGTTIADAFIGLMTATNGSCFEKETAAVSKGLKINAYMLETAGNNEEVSITRGKMSAYDIDFNDVGSVPEDFYDKGFRVYCATCPEQWMNFLFIDGNDEFNASRPKSGTSGADFKTALIDISGATDVKSLVRAIYDQGGDALEHMRNNHSHFLHFAADPEAGKLTVYDERMFNIRERDNSYYALTGYHLYPDLQEKGAKLADGIYDDVIKMTRKLYVNDLVIHHTDKASMNIHLQIPQTSMDHLFGYINGAKSYTDYNVLTQEAREELLGNQAGRMTRDGTRMVKKDEPGLLDTALQYLTDANTLVGAQTSRLETTHDNIITQQESTAASESTIRDADMAKEMTAYTKSNILAQAAQSMLAQANQNSSSVLSLLQ